MFNKFLALSPGTRNALLMGTFILQWPIGLLLCKINNEPSSLFWYSIIYGIPLYWILVFSGIYINDWRKSDLK